MTTRFSIRVFTLAIILVLAMTFAPMAEAATPAGTVITNQSSITYTAEGPVVTELSNIVSLTVAEILSHTLTWQFQ